MTADRDQLADTVINLETVLMEAPKAAQPPVSKVKHPRWRLCTSVRWAPNLTGTVFDPSYGSCWDPQEEKTESSGAVLLAEQVVGELQEIQQGIAASVQAWRVSEEQNESLSADCLRKEDEIAKLRKLLETKELELAQVKRHFLRQQN
eukprot:2907267-Rhodomonas_salina.1